MDYMEETALGMDTFKAMRSEHHLPLPIIEYDGGNTVVTFPRTTEAVRGIIKKQPIEKLSKDELSAFEIFREHKLVSKVDFAKQAGLTNRTAERILKKFTDTNLIRKQGAGPKTNYIINE
jgi:predicted HTH transcriptional regulator